MKIKIFQFNPFGESTIVIYDENTREAIVIDPGMMQQREEDEFDKFIADNNLTIKYLLNTHLHIDHMTGDLHVERKYGVGLSASLDDEILSSRIAEQARMFHLNIDVPASIEIDNPLNDGDELQFSGSTIKVILVPGHSPGSLAFYFPAQGFIVVGDVLFQRSIGRTDLPGGDYDQLIDSIRTKLFTLPDETIVIPGHGPYTTIEEEKQLNPFFT